MIILRAIAFFTLLLLDGEVLSKTKVEHFTTSESIWISYVQLGDTSSPSLIFIHGGPGDNSSDFRSMAEKLSSKYRVLVFDSRGCGLSQRRLLPSQLTIGKMVNDVKELQDHLCLKSTMILGHSFGGAVAIEFSLLHPDRIEKLILCAPLISYTMAQRNRMENGYQDGLTEGDSTKIKIYQKYILGDSISIQDESKMISLSHSWHNPSILDSVYSSVKPRKLGYTRANIETAFYIVIGYFESGFFPNYENLSRANLIKNETIIIGGAEDQLILPNNLRELNASIEGSELMIVDEAGHFPYIEQADQFLEIMVSLIE